MTKDERQILGINKYLRANAIGTLEYVQRFGKTRTAIKIIERFNNRFSDINLLIVVPSLPILKVWEEELENSNAKNYDLVTIDSLLNSKSTIDKNNYRFLIIDEIHKFITETRIELIKGNIIKYTYILGLTGTYPHSNKILNKFCPVVDTITEAEAIANNWISYFEEYNIPLELNRRDKIEYVKHSTTMFNVSQDFKGLYNILLKPNNTPFFNDDLDLILSCYKGKNIKGIGYIKSHYIRESIAVKMGWTPALDLSNNHNKQIEEYWSPDAIKDRVSSYYNAMKARNEIHNINEVKLDAVLKLVAKHKDRIIIIFNESTQFADMITDSINNTFKTDIAISYHSNIKSRPLINFITNEYFKDKSGKVKKFGKKKQLDYITEMLKIRRFKVISTVKALDEGFSVENIDMVITTSGTSNPVTYSQRNARGKTINKYNPDKTTLIINLYFDDFKEIVNDKYVVFRSRDYTKLRLRQQNKQIKTLTLQEFINK